MKIFVTGGTGFLGRHVVDLLVSQGHDLLLVSRSPKGVGIRWPSATALDAREPAPKQLKFVSGFSPDVLLHMAWDGLPDYSPAMSSRNLELGFHYLYLALQADVRRIVGVGSCLEYGLCQGPQIEANAPLELPAAFPQAKAATRSFIASVSQQADLEYRWARPFFIYGPGQRETSLIPSALRRARAGMPMALRDECVALDFVHVLDVARGVATLATQPGPSGAFNLGSGIPRSTKWVAEQVFFEVSGKDAPDEGLPDIESTPGWWADIDLVASAYGWHPVVDIRRGIRDLISGGQQRCRQ